MGSAVMGSGKTGLQWVCLGPPHVAGASFQIEGLLELFDWVVVLLVGKCHR